MNDWGLENPLGARKCVQLLPTSNADRFWRVAIDKSCPILLYTNCRKHIHAAVSSQSFVTLYKVRSEKGCSQSSPVGKASATLSKFIETMNFWSISKPARHPNWVQEKTKMYFFLLKFLRPIKHLRKVQEYQRTSKYLKGKLKLNLAVKRNCTITKSRLIITSLRLLKKLPLIHFTTLDRASWIRYMIWKWIGTKTIVLIILAWSNVRKGIRWFE